MLTETCSIGGAHMTVLLYSTTLTALLEYLAKFPMAENDLQTGRTAFYSPVLVYT